MKYSIQSFIFISFLLSLSVLSSGIQEIPEINTDGTYRGVQIYPCSRLSRANIKISGKLFDSDYQVIPLYMIVDEIEDFACIEYPTLTGDNIYMIRIGGFKSDASHNESHDSELNSTHSQFSSAVSQDSTSSHTSEMTDSVEPVSRNYEETDESMDSLISSGSFNPGDDNLQAMGRSWFEVTAHFPATYDHLYVSEQEIQQAEEGPRPVLTAAFVLGIIMTIGIVVGGITINCLVIKVKSYKTIDVEGGNDIEMATEGEDQVKEILDVKVNGFYKSVLKWTAMIISFTVLATLISAFITILAGFGAFALKSCECSEKGAFCNRQFKLTATDERLVFGKESGFCVFVKRLRLQSGMSCKGGNSEYDDLKDNCSGDFEDIEADICSHFCPFGQKKGKCTTCEFDIQPCEMVRHVSLKVNATNLPRTFSADVSVMPKCDVYVLINSEVFCASSHINTISSLDTYNFFSEEPDPSKLKAIVISKGFITPSSVTCHHLQDTGTLTASALKVQISIQVLATFDSVNKSFCQANITDFDCENTPVSGTDSFYLLSSCYDRQNKRINHAVDSLKSHCGCYWCINGPDTYPCNSNDASRNGTEYATSDKDKNLGENQDRNWFSKNWLFIVLVVGCFLAIVGFGILAVVLFKCCVPS